MAAGVPSKRSPVHLASRTIAKRYKVPTSVIKAIKSLAPAYGSQGRTLQVATELLIRLKKPVKIRPQFFHSSLPNVGMSYKVTPRTAALIDQLTERYGTRGAVLAACAQVLQSHIGL